MTFRTKLLASQVALVAAVVALVMLVLNHSLGSDLARQLDARLEQQAVGAAQWIGEGRRHPEKLASRLALVVNADVTIFDREGAVLGDSTTPEPQAAQHAPEIEAAANGGVGHATRIAPTTGAETVYVAVPAADGMVVRLAAPVSDIDATLRGVRSRLLFAAALAIAAALGLGIVASRFAAQPLRAMTESASRIARGDYDIPPPATSHDDFGILAESLASLATQLKARIGDLTTERDRLSAILTGMVEGVVVVGEDGLIVLANPAAEKIVGADAIVGRRIDEAIAAPAIRAFIDGAIGSATAKDDEVEAAGRAIELHVRPLGATGRGVVAVLRDMTGLRKLMTIRRDFVANVSHEIRTPVAAIMGYAETLLSRPFDEATRREFLEVIHRQSKRIAALVEDLLQLSALEARPPDETVREPMEIAPIARGVAQAIRARTGDAGASLEIDVGDDVVAIGDPSALEQVLLTLVDNAVKYGAVGGHVVVRATRDGSRVHLAIEDDGPGIAAEHLPRLFERFYRVDPGRSRDRGGTGLGLAIVKHNVEAMGGVVRVESEVGKGARVLVDLPAPI